MMRIILLEYIRKYYLIVFVAMATLVYIAQQMAFELPSLINNFLNDLLCMPIVLKICQQAVRYIKGNRALQIPIGVALALTLLYALYFELVLPKFNLRYTGDIIDVILYGLGCLFFIEIERFRTRETSVFKNEIKSTTSRQAHEALKG